MALSPEGVMVATSNEARTEAKERRRYVTRSCDPGHMIIRNIMCTGLFCQSWPTQRETMWRS